MGAEVAPTQITERSHTGATKIAYRLQLSPAQNATDCRLQLSSRQISHTGATLPETDHIQVATLGICQRHLACHRWDAGRHILGGRSHKPVGLLTSVCHRDRRTGHFLATGRVALRASPPVRHRRSQICRIVIWPVKYDNTNGDSAKSGQFGVANMTNRLSSRPESNLAIIWRWQRPVELLLITMPLITLIVHLQRPAAQAGEVRRL